jgi:glycosyltransferase involved in cell wall biosynthesis
LKICLITEFFYPDDTGSTPTLLSELVRYLKDNYGDVDIDVVTSHNLYREAKYLARFENWDGIRIFRVATPATNRLSGPFRLAGGILFSAAVFLKILCMRERFDLIFVGTNPPAAPSVAKLLQWLIRTPYVYLIHDLYPEIAIKLGALSENSLSARIGKRLQSGWLRAAKKVIVLGQSVRDYVLEAYGLPEDKVVTIPLWINPERACYSKKSTKFLKTHGLDRFVALYFGNIGPLQGVDIVVDAAKLVQHKCNDVVFLIIGNGTQEKDIERRIEQENITNVRLFPVANSEEVADILASADVSLVPVAPGMDRLVTPIKFYTIMASGRPTVATVGTRSEVARIMQESECGLRVEPGNACEFADAVIKLRNEPDLAKKMGENARQAALSKYVLQNVAEHYYQAFVSARRDNDCSSL